MTACCNANTHAVQIACGHSAGSLRGELQRRPSSAATFQRIPAACGCLAGYDPENGEHMGSITLDSRALPVSRTVIMMGCSCSTHPPPSPPGSRAVWIVRSVKLLAQSRDSRSVRLLAQSKARTQSTAAPAAPACCQYQRASSCRRCHLPAGAAVTVPSQASRPGPPANGELASEVALGA